MIDDGRRKSREGRDGKLGKTGRAGRVVLLAPVPFLPSEVELPPEGAWPAGSAAMVAEDDMEEAVQELEERTELLFAADTRLPIAKLILPVGA